MRCERTTELWLRVAARPGLGYDRPVEATIFPSAAAFRAWLETHHATEPDLWVGYYRKRTGKQSITYSEAVDEALCFGWIDGITRRIDETSWANRFTPRRAAASGAT